MIRRFSTLVIACALAAAGGFGFAGPQFASVDAQDAAPDPQPQPSPDGEVEVDQGAALSGSDQLTESERIQQRGMQVSRRSSSMLNEARNESDIIRATCLDDKLTQVNANLRTVDGRLVSLRDAVEAGDTSRRNHEYTVIVVLGQKFVVLEQQANQCVGQDIYETSATRVTTTIDANTPLDDAIYIDFVPAIPVPAIPPAASATI